MQQLSNLIKQFYARYQFSVTIQTMPIIMVIAAKTKQLDYVLLTTILLSSIFSTVKILRNKRRAESFQARRMSSFGTSYPVVHKTGYNTCQPCLHTCGHMYFKCKALLLSHSDSKGQIKDTFKETAYHRKCLIL